MSSLDDELTESQGRELVLDLLRRVEDEPSLLGLSSHLPAVARRAWAPHSSPGS